MESIFVAQLSIQWLVYVAIVIGFLALGLFAFFTIASNFYIKVGPDEAIVRTGYGGIKS